MKPMKIHLREKTSKEIFLFLWFYDTIFLCTKERSVSSVIEIIVNPVAGSGAAKETALEVEKYLQQKGQEFKIIYTEYPNHASQLARDAASRGVETVVALGGDGTVSETAEGLVNSKTALGIIPAGTGNDFIKTVGVPAHWKAAVDFLLEHPARPVNTGLVNERLFMNACGMGFDELVLEYSLEAKKHAKGIWPYLYGVFKAIFTFKPIEMHIEIDGQEPMHGKYMICSIANGRYIGGGIPIMPIADIGDGLLDILVVDSVPRWVIPFYLPSILMGTLYKKKVAHHYRASRCLLRSEGAKLNLDGEIVPVDETLFLNKPDALLMHW